MRVETKLWNCKRTLSSCRAVSASSRKRSELRLPTNRYDVTANTGTVANAARQAGGSFCQKC